MSERVSIPIAKLIDCKGWLDGFAISNEYRCALCGQWMPPGPLSPCQAQARLQGKLSARVAAPIAPLPATAPTRG